MSGILYNYHPIDDFTSTSRRTSVKQRLAMEEEKKNAPPQILTDPDANRERMLRLNEKIVSSAQSLNYIKSNGIMTDFSKSKEG